MIDREDVDRRLRLVGVRDDIDAVGDEGSVKVGEPQTA